MVSNEILFHCSLTVNRNNRLLILLTAKRQCPDGFVSWADLIIILGFCMDFGHSTKDSSVIWWMNR
jgi:hypothetical protein